MEQRTLHILEYDKIIAMLATRALSGPGRVLCEALLPTSAVDEAMERQSNTDDAVRILLAKGTPPFSGLTDLRPTAARAVAGAVLGCKELMQIAALLRGAARLQAFVPSEPGENRVYAAMGRLLPVPSLEQAISMAIIGEDELSDRASPALYSIRRRIRDAQAKVKEILDRIVRTHPRILQEQLVTMRGDRYVVPVRAEYRNELSGIVHDVSSSGSTLFVEPIAVVEANNKIRELMSQEAEEIERILAALSAQAAEHADAISVNVSTMAWIDFQIAKARLAFDMKAMPPVLNTEGKIRLRGARHPLIPHEQVVPIDFHIGYAFRTLVITGPNTGGKTVALKTCGLLCLMAAAGLQIPAQEHSEVSLFDEILADIGDEQSIEQNLSTFSSHMSNIVNITRRAARGTLVLVDELGSGTDPSEGAALAISILDHLRTHGCVTVATTHYKELKGYAIETPEVENACCEFDTETLRPTYRLLIGVPGVSNAFVISGKLGLGASIIEAAKQRISEEGMRFEELLQDVEKSHAASLRMRDETLAIRNVAKQEAERVETLRLELEQKRAGYLQTAREEARRELAAYLQEAETLLDQAREALRSQDSEAAEHLAAEARKGLRDTLRTVEGEIGRATLDAYDPAAIPDKIVVGQTYYAASLHIEGKVVNGPDARDCFTLVSGSVKATVPRSSLRLPGRTREKEKRTPRGSAASSAQGRRRSPVAAMSRAMTFQSEIQLLGLTVDEALATLDKYLDEAVLSGAHGVRIVHGKGTGALRSAVSQFLRKDTRVQTFRLGAYGEGDSGVTLAELK
ncbi:MAG: endonuclease MutS2 [Clostridiaceae bacterium]|nr:endonuclease MutS2 [Clostridiaceae bacterium]